MATEEFTGEEWRPIRGLPYEVSSHGRVRRSEDARTRKAGTYLRGAIQCSYRCVRLFAPGYDKQRPIHQLVAEAFLGERPAGMQVNHKDGNKLNNRVENLEWVTPRDNSMHAIRMGLTGVGERSGRARMTNALVREIRAARAAGDKKSIIAKRLGVSRDAVYRATNPRMWTHI